MTAGWIRVVGQVTAVVTWRLVTWEIAPITDQTKLDCPCSRRRAFPRAAPGGRAHCRRDPAGHEAARLSDTFRRPVSRRIGGVERNWQPSMATGGDGWRRESRRKRPSAT